MSSVGTSSGIGFSQTSSSGGRETSNSASNGRNSSVSSTEEDNGISDSPVTEHKRKYRRHAKPDKNAPVKPPSAYVMFSNKVRAELKDQNMSFVDLAKIVGDRWKAISPEEKEHYEQTAAREKEDYQAALSRYEQTDDHKAYQQYLSEFKSKQEVAGMYLARVCHLLAFPFPCYSRSVGSSAVPRYAFPPSPPSRAKTFTMRLLT